MKGKKLTLEFIKQNFISEGYIIVSTEYVNAHSYLNFICPNGHKHKIKWYNWKLGKRCGMCFGTHKHEYKFIKESFESEGYTLLSTEYKNTGSYLNYICPNGHQHKIIWDSWRVGHRCGLCNITISKPEKEILNFIENSYTGTIIPNDRTTIVNPKTGLYLELDIWLPEIRKAIEYNGDYYHNNRYTKWKDNYKQKYCQENGIDLLVITHDNWAKNKDFNIISSFIF